MSEKLTKQVHRRGKRYHGVWLPVQDSTELIARAKKKKQSVSAMLRDMIDFVATMEGK